MQIATTFNPIATNLNAIAFNFGYNFGWTDM